jgi:hypothetical protein
MDPNFGNYDAGPHAHDAGVPSNGQITPSPYAPVPVPPPFPSMAPPTAMPTLPPPPPPSAAPQTPTSAPGT